MTITKYCDILRPCGASGQCHSHNSHSRLDKGGVQGLLSCCQTFYSILLEGDWVLPSVVTMCDKEEKTLVQSIEIVDCECSILPGYIIYNRPGSVHCEVSERRHRELKLETMFKARNDKTD